VFHTRNVWDCGLRRAWQSSHHYSLSLLGSKKEFGNKENSSVKMLTGLLSTANRTMVKEYFLFLLS